uniref:Uncharacterized protein n=1 Tax=Tanacetum cinerariifolium TaxID=118510 RepID=A0A6L2MPW2_TANCI|nr:hypothetical protein [Tanacetum cinerariifolium]
MEPKKVAQALDDESWVKASQDELLQFSLQKVWRLVDLPYRKKDIETKWVYKNKKDKRGIVVRNKARLVAQEHRQEEGINYDKVFAPVARTEAIKIFLAFASFMRFIVYQMDVQSAFLYGTIEKEVYNEYKRGIIDNTLFIKTDKDDIMLMSSMRELTFSLGLQVKKSEEEIFISQDKYVAEILKKFDFSFVRIASTPIETQKPLVKDEEATNVDVHLYRSMIGSLIYLTASRPDIMYLKCQRKLGLWYPRDSLFDLEAYSDSNYARANLDRKSKTGGCQFLGRILISWQCGNPQYTLQDQGILNSGCSRNMTGNKSFLTDYQEIDGGFVAFGGSPKGGKISRKGKIRTKKLDFEDVYFVKELKFNLLFVS